MNILQFPEQKKPLANYEIEMLLIVSAMLHPNRFHEINILDPEDFSTPENSDLWRIIRDMILTDRKPTPQVIAVEMHAEKNDQDALRLHLTDWIASIANPSSAPDYAKTIKDLSSRRRIVETAKNLLAMAEDTSCGFNADEILGLGVSSMMPLGSHYSGFQKAHDVGRQIVANLDKDVPVTRTGLPRLDRALGGGLYQGRYYGFAARMKSGKSLLLSTLAYHMAVIGPSRVLYLCLEMGAEESLERILSMSMGCNSLDFRKDIRKTPEFKRCAKEANDALENCGLSFRSQPRMTLDDLKSAIARAGMSGKFDGIIVDYLQLVEGKTKNQSTAEHYDNVSQTLAEAVKRYPIWIAAAAQLNKEGTIRGSEGLLMACDLALSINKIEGHMIMTMHGEEKTPDRAWLETMVSRYTPYTDVGSEEDPAYEIDANCGPMFVEMRR